jgi:hypothetical protein
MKGLIAEVLTWLRKPTKDVEALREWCQRKAVVISRPEGAMRESHITGAREQDRSRSFLIGAVWSHVRT